MIRRTDESTIFGYSVITLPPLRIFWSYFTTPEAQGKPINQFRKDVSKRARMQYRNAMSKWKV